MSIVLIAIHKKGEEMEEQKPDIETINAVKEQLFTTENSKRINNTMRHKLKTSRERAMQMLKQIAEENISLTETDFAKITELGDFMKNYIKQVGEENAIAHLQTGLNMLTGYRKNALTPELVKLEEDSVFGEKTMHTLLYVLRNYSLDVIKNYIRLGIINNVIEEANKFDDINTDDAISYFDDKLTERN